MNRHREAELDGEAAHQLEPRHLLLSWSLALLEVQADLSDDHHALSCRKNAQRIDIGPVGLRRVVANAGPDLKVLVRQLDRTAAALEVRADRDKAGHAGGHGGADHLRGLAQLLEVEMSVDESYGRGSSPTTSSRRLNRATGTGSLRPGSSSDGCQRSATG